MKKLIDINLTDRAVIEGQAEEEVPEDFDSSHLNQTRIFHGNGSILSSGNDSRALTQFSINSC